LKLSSIKDTSLKLIEPQTTKKGF